MAPRKSRKRCAFVYLLLCADGSIYTGWTRDVARRLEMHAKGRGARYTRARRPLRLIYHERLPSRRDAMKRESEIKRWPRARKLKLAQSKRLRRASPALHVSLIQRGGKRQR